MAKVRGVVVISGGSVEDVEKVIHAAEKATEKVTKVTLAIFN